MHGFQGFIYQEQVVVGRFDILDQLVAQFPVAGFGNRRSFPGDIFLQPLLTGKREHLHNSDLLAGHRLLIESETAHRQVHQINAQHRIRQSACLGNLRQRCLPAIFCRLQVGIVCKGFLN